jgi:2-polyprenyl-3-methyl-5-hydroxy-6-metoxy-1,4-benzoquinol methylase
MTDAHSLGLIAARSNVTVEELPDGRRRLSVSADRSAMNLVHRWDTAYPPDLIRAIVDVKGTAALDEIRRDEDESYVAVHLRDDLLAYLPPQDFEGRRLLDFGCGAGASTMCLARLFPATEVVGIDYRRDLINLAELRMRYYAHSMVRFACSPDPDHLPVGIGPFDYVVFSAVYEHLLPHERAPLLSNVWSVLRTGGVLFLDQTPHRYWPIEAHTTRLPLLNYMPARLALVVARRFSRRVPRQQGWDALLRRGIRGGTEQEIVQLLKQAGGGAPELLEPSRFGLRDRIDLWYYSSTRTRGHPLKKILRHGLKALRCVAGITLVPRLALAIRKGTWPDAGRSA